MLLWFLRLLPAFRSLERDSHACREAIEALTIDKLRLQDRLDAALADKEHLWAAMQEAMNNERDALRMQVNHAVQKAGGGVPYPDSHSLPASAAREPQAPGPVGRRGRVLASELAQQRTNEFIAELVRGPNG